MEKKRNFKFDRKIELGESVLHGLGVFATEDIKEGEIVEKCPLVVLQHRMNYQIDPVVWSHMYTNTCPCDECKKHGGQFLMVLGYAQLYNHQDNNNAAMQLHVQDEYAEIKALRDIKKGSEIYINYGSKYFQRRPKITVDESGKPISIENGSQGK